MKGFFIPFLYFFFLFPYSSKTYAFSDTTSGFDTQTLERVLLHEINKLRAMESIDSLEANGVLFTAADHHAVYMAKTEKADLSEDKKKFKNTGARVKYYGGTTNAFELVIASPVSKGKDLFNTRSVIDAILLKWRTGKKERPVFMNAGSVYIGIASKVDQKNKKVFVSAVFGSFNTFNSGADKRKTMAAPYTKKVKKVKAPVNAAKECKNCDKFKNYPELINGVFVDKGQVFLKYDDIKQLKKLFKKPKDGIMIDVVQRAQYTAAEYNIMDNNLVSKGIVSKKPLYNDAFWKRNRLEGEKGKKPTGYLGQIGVVPKKVKGQYEVNLLIIQDGKVCRTITKSYLEEGDIQSETPIDLLLMPDSDAYLKPLFQPTADNTILSFTIPFEKNKADYKQEDIQPILDALNEPDFIIEGLYVYAYSSIEGDSMANARLQSKRAESIISTFREMQKERSITASVKTSDSWDLFRLVMEDGKYADLTTMRKSDAIRKINSDKALLDELEPFLSKQRFAQVVLDITYDIKGNKEEKYCAALFNKAVKKGDQRTAYKIQYFIEDQVGKGKYASSVLDKLEIPKEAKYSGYINNALVYSYLRNKKVLGEGELKKWEELSKLDPTNVTVQFNYVFLQVKEGEFIAEKNFSDQLQTKVDGMYKSSISKKAADGLNIELQFKIIEAFDTVENAEPIIESSMNRIKNFYNFKDGSWQNALKLSYVFARFKDFKFASQILEPYFVNKTEANEQLLFSYISFCAQLPEKTKSRNFVMALQMASKVNKERYCKLFGEPFLTFQVLDNPFVKKDFQENSCPVE